MSSDLEPVRRPGGRAARVRAAVLAAVEAELLDHGYDALTVDAVAERAGVHRATVYRRWHDVGGLLADALDAGREDDWRPPDHGSLPADLAALNREVLVHLTAERSPSRALIVAAYRSAAAADALRRFLDDRYRRNDVWSRGPSRAARCPPAPMPGGSSWRPPRRSTTWSCCSARPRATTSPSGTPHDAALAAIAGGYDGRAP